MVHFRKTLVPIHLYHEPDPSSNQGPPIIMCACLLTNNKGPWTPWHTLEVGTTLELDTGDYGSHASMATAVYDSSDSKLKVCLRAVQSTVLLCTNCYQATTSVAQL